MFFKEVYNRQYDKNRMVLSALDEAKEETSEFSVQFEEVL
jgi:hypothetical protein